ncbi:non-hydrolyzing UDP-N-acetylglucosamine 2-epimerase [Vulgatibacter incomptus]|uniref:UDP-N-acetylglucosamine 2-epimerase (non-hydrolyzing) n=1 Tax=Vulgatibacter incomptus TaxID=1391653 RepID=A0A0K1PHW4_9BACT|nr:UDP-N-acetylglucosamine 2-epimerase (non-hydrolyzing) [Vulgatibacter incomptus]AKU93102.1 UDP-N-acetylglucosamine 2-epimerase [Vulgatibacter incomptus]
MKRKILVVMGTRPEAIKLAPVVRELRGQTDLCEVLVVSTGQHREMLAQVLAIFGLEPDVNLEVMTPGQDLFDITSRTLLGMRTVLQTYKPDCVIVQGDTTTALGAAMAAFFERIPVAHVEAGLRTGDRCLPFPEEMNRRLIDQIAEWMFTPTRRSRDALIAEGVEDSRVTVTGNTVIDALLATRALAQARAVEIPGLPAGCLDGLRPILVTAHRRESFGRTIDGICRALVRVVDQNPDVAVVYPVHLNPNIDGPVRRILGGRDRIHLLPPLGYLEFVSLMDRSHLVLSDSGGLQEETPSLGKPILVLRDVTERPEGIEAGVAMLVGTNEDGIVNGVQAVLSDPALFEKMARGANPYGDGTASERIAKILLSSSPTRHQTKAD